MTTNAALKIEQARQSIPQAVLSVDRMGRIVAVTGSRAVVLLDSEDTDTHEARKFGAEIGNLMKVETSSGVALALISALSSPTPTQDRGDREMRIVEVEFIGELPRRNDGSLGQFRRGISGYPALGDPVFKANRMELAMAYACDVETAVRVGHIQQDPTIPAMLKVDEMLGKHCAILGATGTGKSCTVALIMRRILEKNPQAHILLLDVHREYSQSFKGISEVISPDNMALPFWLLNFDEATEILVGQQSGREVDIEVLREIIPMAKARYMSNQRRDKGSALRQRDVIVDNNIGVDTPIPYRTSDLISVLDESLGKLDLKNELAPYKRLKAKLEAISRDPRYAFMFGSITVQDNMTQVLARIFRIPVNGKPVAILELGGLPSEIINVVVSVLARLAFDFGVWSQGRVPITFVCEEAHRYVPNDATTGFEPTKRAISRIAKEGRKYGVSLCIVTQRPAELDPTILSQCNTVFSMRLSNERDQQILRAGISDAAESLMDFMPTMGAGEAISFGEGVALPTRIKFDLLPSNELPRSTTSSFTHHWNHSSLDENFLTDVVTRWRAQTYNPESDGDDLLPPPPPPRQTSTFAASVPVQNHAPSPAAGVAPAPGVAPIKANFLRRDVLMNNLNAAKLEPAPHQAEPPVNAPVAEAVADAAPEAKAQPQPPVHAEAASPAEHGAQPQEMPPVPPVAAPAPVQAAAQAPAATPNLADLIRQFRK